MQLQKFESSPRYRFCY